MKFNKAAYEYIKQSIKALDSLRLSVEERLWLRRTCPYFPEDYLDWLSHFRLHSDKEVIVAFKQEEDSDFGELDIASAYPGVRHASALHWLNDGLHFFSIY